MHSNTKQYNFNKITDTSTLFPIKDDWQKSLTAPQDDMWESFMNYASHWEIKAENQTIGYACVNEENCLLQFYILPAWMQDGVLIFQEFIGQQKIDKAMIGTNNPFCLSVAMQVQQSVKVDTYLFTDVLKVEPIQKDGTLKAVELQDLELLVNFYNENMGAPKEWLNGYLGNLIEHGELFVLEHEQEILGTCEVRKSESDPKVAGVGMAVATAQRRKGLGTFLLGKAKEIAIEWDRQPICSCETDNTGSLKSIRSNGFRSVQQMLLMEF